MRTQPTDERIFFKKKCVYLFIQEVDREWERKWQLKNQNWVGNPVTVMRKKEAQTCSFAAGPVPVPQSTVLYRAGVWGRTSHTQLLTKMPSIVSQSLCHGLLRESRQVSSQQHEVQVSVLVNNVKAKFLQPVKPQLVYRARCLASSPSPY